MTTKQKTVHYLKLYVELQSQAIDTERYVDLTFEHYLDKAIETLPSEANPEQFLTTTGKKVSLSLLKGELVRLHGCKAGVIYVTEEGKQVTAEEETEYGKHIVGAHPAIVKNSDEEGTHEEQRGAAERIQLAPLANGVTYFAVCGNYVAYFSDSPNAANRMRSFFEYLLKSLSKVIPENAILHLENKLIINPRIAVNHGGISAIHYQFGGILEENSIEQQIQSTINGKIQGNELDKLRHEAILQQCNIQLLVSPGRGNKGIKDDTLKTLANSMSDTELEHTIIVFKDGNVLRGSQICPNGRVNVEVNNGVPSQASALRAISKWLSKLIETRLS